MQLHLALPHGTPHSRLEQVVARVPWKSRDSTQPVRLALLDQCERCVGSVRAWADHALPCRPSLLPERPGPQLQALCEHLTGNLSRCLRTADDGRHAAAVWASYARGRTLLGREAPPVRLAEPCPVCDLRSLAVAQDTVLCRSCRSRWPRSAFRSAGSA
ncbi:hypothetical protein ACFVVA_24240 [Kitasatospora sp. NPDC058048]|uniref:hypothetical protein n=1 Tax=Kitasatospora sp. NPDC058048 TaxID=3346313 RepID=UPI0036DC403A